ncbi:MAG: hypothetical protein LBD96_03070 [Treponema sp.]|jgi:hypothetical protein|nr:hypothetical protein [Treponema sp.]
MNMRAAPFVLFALLGFPCGAQSPPAIPPESLPSETEESSGIFPLSLVLEALQGQTVRQDQTGRQLLYWRPDWPLEIPPDTFAVRGASVIELNLDVETESGEAEIPGSTLGQYRLAWDSRGRLTDMPLALPVDGPAQDPLFVQVRLRYGEGDGLTAIDIEIPPQERSLSIRFEAPYVPGILPPVRLEYGDRFYHVRFHVGIHEITETWFDPWGIFSAYFKSRVAGDGTLPDRRLSGVNKDSPWRVLGLEGAEYTREESGAFSPVNPFKLSLFYESGGSLSESSGEYGSFSAIYGKAGRPLYWSRDSRTFSLQWDQGGRLVRLRDLTDGDPPVDFRYDYEFDARGNWIRRRETALFRAGNLLLPAYSRDLVRRIVYAEGDGEGEGDGGLD